jgi:hypothetical protein
VPRLRYFYIVEIIDKLSQRCFVFIVIPVPRVPLSPEPGVGTAGGRGHLTVCVGQLIEPLLDDHADETISHELEVRARGRRVPDDGLQLLDLIGAPQHLEFLSQWMERRRRLGYRGTGRLVAFHRGSFVLGYRAHSPANKERGL